MKKSKWHPETNRYYCEWLLTVLNCMLYSVPQIIGEFIVLVQFQKSFNNLSCVFTISKKTAGRFFLYDSVLFSFFFFYILTSMWVCVKSQMGTGLAIIGSGTTMLDYGWYTNIFRRIDDIIWSNIPRQIIVVLSVPPQNCIQPREQRIWKMAFQLKLLGKIIWLCSLYLCSQVGRSPFCPKVSMFRYKRGSKR